MLPEIVSHLWPLVREGRAALVRHSLQRIARWYEHVQHGGMQLRRTSDIHQLREILYRGLGSRRSSRRPGICRWGRPAIPLRVVVRQPLRRVVRSPCACTAVHFLLDHATCLKCGKHMAHACLLDGNVATSSSPGRRTRDVAIGSLLHSQLVTACGQLLMAPAAYGNKSHYDGFLAPPVQTLMRTDQHAHPEGLSASSGRSRLMPTRRVSFAVRLGAAEP